jgi:precorrin-2 dehydrogenase/sirohydrochlorin ferrochelatase
MGADSFTGKELIDTKLYIACINLTGRPCLVVGGGSVALEKIEGLLACGAAVRVVAPETHPEVEALAASSSIELHRRPYETADLDGCFLAIAATSNTEVNTHVHHDAEARSRLVNVADVPALCNFILPAIVRTGPIAIAISTAGASPALAQRMRNQIAELFGPHYAHLAVILNDLREWAKGALPTYQDRKEFFESIVHGKPDPIELLEEGDVDGVEALIAEARRRAEESLRVQK